LEYLKKALNYSEQADLLISRNLIADKNELVDFLREKNYYRLSGYWYHYLDVNNKFYPRITLEVIKRNYNFDCELREILYRQIELIEVSLKAKVVYVFAHKYGSFGYLDENNLPNLSKDDYDKLVLSFKESYDKSKELFVTSFKKKYGDIHKNLPIWMLSELMTFGMLLNLFDGLKEKDKNAIAIEYDLNSRVLFSWILTMNTYRNIIAHYGRIWKRRVLMHPLLPTEKYHPEWYDPYPIDTLTIFGILTIMNYLNKNIQKPVELKKIIAELFVKYGDSYRRDLGFSGDWKNHKLWL